MKILRPTTKINWSDPLPDYDRIYQMREDNLKQIRKSPGAISALLAYYADGHWPEFISDWGMTYDPRETDPRLKHRPFILYPRQIDLVQWTYARYVRREKGLLEKFRGCGFTWLGAAMASTLWLTTPMAIVGFGSRKKELVDNGSADPDSILWKVRQFIDELPAIFLPDNYDSGRKWGVIPNVSNGATVKGEIGDEIGRGGRAQPTDTPVLTPHGWIPIGAVRPGMEVIGSDGKATTVVAIHPHGVQQVYQIAFSDGSSTESCEEHMWHVTDEKIRKANQQELKRKPTALGRGRVTPRFLVLPLKRIRQKIAVNRLDGKFAARYQIPMVAPVEYADINELPLSPYIIGVLLGDGHVSGKGRHAPGFSSSDFEIPQEVSKELPFGLKLIESSTKTNPDFSGNPCYQYEIVSIDPARGRSNHFKAILNSLGMLGCLSYDKQIPEQYLFAARWEDRLSLLQGLIDTDGAIISVNKGKSCRVDFYSVSKQLAQDVVSLVQSLGGTATLRQGKADFRTFPNGGKYYCAERYTVTIAMPDGMQPARLSRKLANFTKRTRFKPFRSIVSVLPSRKTEVVCITVANADGLYVTNDYVLTHNSSIYFADEYAHLEHQEMAEAALSENADCVIFGSTVNGVGNNFYRLRHFLPDEQVFVFDWTEDERKRLNPQLPAEEEPWFRKKKSEVSPTVFASQYLRKYDASVANSFVSDELISGAFVRSKVSLVETKANWRIGVDASGMGNDKSVIWRRRGRLSLPALVFEKIDGVQLAAIIEREAKKLLASGPVELIAIEQDGPGGSAADQLRYGPFASILVSLHTGVKLGDGHNYNMRAYLHAEAKGYLEEELPIIPPDEIFRTQATALQFSYKNGLLLIESKDDYRARFSGGRTRVEKASGKSPDRWDAFVLTFTPPRGKPLVSLKSSSAILSAKNWRPLDTTLGY